MRVGLLALHRRNELALAVGKSLHQVKRVRQYENGKAASSGPIPPGNAKDELAVRRILDRALIR